MPTDFFMDSSCLSIATPDIPEADPLRPLRLWASRLKRTLPAVMLEPGSGLPAPFRALLDHQQAMTGTLARAYQARIRLEVMSQWDKGPMVDRLVRLRAANGENPVVETAALHIHLDALPADARSAVLSGAEPLGSVLHSHAIAHRHDPRGFFFLTTNPWLAELLERPAGEWVAGRCNAIHTMHGALIAEIVECIPNPGPTEERKDKR